MRKTSMILVNALFFATTACGSSQNAKARTNRPKPPDTVLETCPQGMVCECDDGVDNDGDGLVDWMADLGCTARNDATEGGLQTGAREGGWTIFEPTADTRIVYVSAEGDDSADGLSQATPKRTIAGGAELLRSGSGDWLLLRRGDTFEGFEVNGAGRSAQAPLVVSSYGSATERPILTDDEIRYSAGGNFVVAHLEFSGTHFSFAENPANVLIEGCHFENGVISSSDGEPGNRHNLELRRNVMTRTNTPFFMSNVQTLLIEENVLYRPSVTAGGNHGMYITRAGNQDVTTRGNIVFYGEAETPGNGIMQRPGGLSEDNVVAQVPWVGIAIGACNDGNGDECAPPVTATARNNLIVERMVSTSVGIELHSEFVSSGEAVDNIVGDDRDGVDAPPVSHNSGVTETGTVYLDHPADPARPTVTLLGLYSADVLGGEATTDAFFQAAILQRKYAFRPELTAKNVIAHVRQNYALPQ